MPRPSSNRGHISEFIAVFHFLSAHSGAAKTRGGSKQFSPDRSVSGSVDGITRKIDDLPESLENEKTIWEYYNEMAAVDDNIREIEWRYLADTVLLFVCMDTLHDI